ncbi:hypothetical protein RBG61_11955 [Paludicola sp. MB14-C6]|uniref:hypothetical protein n=1 Tax=Paludihabitans sp. MB14-C6 TaxID=3070656 RepID=UPI0027DBF456|nr:hypothetical protein [Paludicola sp. MB14-C6]WMJ22697.1 hypothetical protein RBG61_11955 [Paludicola sp. MB14-C6]
MSLKMFTKKEKPLSLKRKVNISIGKDKPLYFIREFNEAKETLKYKHKESEYKKLIVTSTIFAVCGFLLGLLFQNILLSPVLAVGLALIPVWRVKLSRHKYDLFVADELESGLSTITSAYIRKNNLIAAVEENMENLNDPLKETMQLFLCIVNKATPSVSYGIKTIQPLIKNDIWDEWCTELIKCQSNSSLRPNLIRIVRKLSDIKMIQSDIDVEMSKCVKEFMSILFLALLGIPLVYVANSNWFTLYFTNPYGKAALLFVAVVILVCLGKLVTLMKPIRYRR